MTNLNPFEIFLLPIVYPVPLGMALLILGALLAVVLRYWLKGRVKRARLVASISIVCLALGLVLLVYGLTFNDPNFL